MPLITFSVGRGGVNLPQDVAAVQSALNALECRADASWTPFQSGKMDILTQIRIASFQGRFLPMQTADGLIRPYSMAESLLMSLAWGAAATKPAMVTYADDIATESRIVDSYAIAVIEKALTAAKMTAAKITSTLRLPAEQAAIMYRNAAVNLDAQYKMYGAAGDAVLDIYKANKAKPQADVVALMADKIQALLDGGRQVSNHVSTPEKYKKLNIIDIGVNSTRKVAGKSFNLAALTKAFTSLEKQGYIRKLIDETQKSNSCWHLEIVPGAKKL